ncbi:MAG: YtxH domain-containing protein [Muribaculaceae bacterium]|nr:YtxH domain-containing protein [Muribaculaceae bacterium]
MKHTEAILAGLGGLLVGAAAALLLAPKKGDHLRSDIKRFLKEKGISLKKNKLEELVDEIAQEIK